MSAEYVTGSDLPNLAVTWRDDDGDIIDFSTGWTFEVKVGHPGSAAEFTKTSGITGAATAPNVTVAWATTGELNNLARGSYTVQIKATRSSDEKQRFMQARISVISAVT